MNQVFDLQRHFHIAAAVESLPGSAFIGFELRKLGFPEAKHIRLYAAQARHISDAEVKPIRNRGSFVCGLSGRLW
jgi:hypothetical protein